MLLPPFANAGIILVFFWGGGGGALSRYKYFCPHFMAFYLAHELKTMKDVVKWHSVFTKQNSDETSRAFAAFSRDVDEDNSIPREIKAKMLQKVGKLMWTLTENEDSAPDYQYLACELEEFYAHDISPSSYNTAAAATALDSDDDDDDSDDNDDSLM